MAKNKQTAFEMAKLEQFELLPDIIRSRTVARYVALCAVLLALIALIALILLLPLKEKYAFPILVDSTTGHAIIMQTPADMNRLHTDTITALDRHWIQQFIHARESYLPERLSEYYARVHLMSCPAEFDHYAWHFARNNPQNYYTIYKDLRVRANIKTIKPAAPHTDPAGNTWRAYTVNMERQFQRPNDSAAATPRFVSYEISLSVRFRELKLQEEILRRNPLGFEVCHYHRDEYLDTGQ